MKPDQDRLEAANDLNEPRGGFLGELKPSQKYLKFPSQPIWASWSVG